MQTPTFSDSFPWQGSHSLFYTTLRGTPLSFNLSPSVCVFFEYGSEVIISNVEMPEILWWSRKENLGFDEKVWHDKGEDCGILGVGERWETGTTGLALGATALNRPLSLCSSPRLNWPQQKKGLQSSDWRLWEAESCGHGLIDNFMKKKMGLMLPQESSGAPYSVVRMASLKKQARSYWGWGARSFPTAQGACFTNSHWLCKLLLVSPSCKMPAPGPVTDREKVGRTF